MKAREEFRLEDYRQERLTIDIVWANIFGVLILIPIAFIFGLPYYLIWKDTFSLDAFDEFVSKHIGFSFPLIAFAVLVLGIIAHELIHGIFWAQYAKNGFKSIKFGILLKMLTPYCHCKEALKVKHYIIGAVMPAIILGIIPSIIAICIGNIGLLAFGIIFTMAAAGDFLIINLLRKENKEDWVQDHPSEAGCYIYRKNNE
ncbi:hypothetical protein AGMMS50262_08320 [Bacteroidia bacterium]|nr:hypothetical protein AGMMS50262_08320 [Bacteroidia bacterium]